MIHMVHLVHGLNAIDLCFICKLVSNLSLIIMFVGDLTSHSQCSVSLELRK